MSESHIRGISAALSLLDKALCEFDEWARGKEIRSVLYEVQNPLTRGQGEAIAELVGDMWMILKQLEETLNLEKSVRTANKLILGSCSVNWVSLAETESRHLRRYGSLPSGLAEYLDPKVALLADKLKKIENIVATSDQ
jgi:hypothetical protein